MSRSPHLASLLCLGQQACAEVSVTVWAGQWQQTDLEFKDDSCLVTDRITAVEDQLIYPLSARELSPEWQAINVGRDRALAQGQKQSDKAAPRRDPKALDRGVFDEY